MKARNRKRACWLKKAAIALLVSFACSFTLSAWRQGTRSANALDELYYATIDSRCYDALFHGNATPDVLASAFSVVKSKPVDYMSTVESWHGGYYLHRSILKGGLGDLDGLNDIGRSTEFKFLEDAANENGASAIEWRVFDGWNSGDSIDQKPRVVDIDVYLPMASFNSEAVGDVQVSVVYDVSRKIITGERGLTIFLAAYYDTKYEGYYGKFSSEKECFRKLGINSEEVLEAAMSVIKDGLLPSFLSRGSDGTRFSSDFEQDGVIVDIDLNSKADG